jgi:hypothetical protein
MNNSIVLKTCEYLGDHSKEIAIALDINPETTIAELMKIVFDTGIKTNAGIRVGDPTVDHIEIRKLNSPNQ